MSNQTPLRAAAVRESQRHIRARTDGLAWAVSAACVLCASAAGAADRPEADPHAQHREMIQAPPAVMRSTVTYTVPNITMVRSDGAHVNLAQELNDGRPVLLDFIYTTCTTTCPVLSQTFAEVQRRLGPQAATVKMVSVSIDPEEDTPRRLSEYAKQFRAGAQWTFYTGTVQASIAAQRAFDVYRGDKMNHVPAILFRGAPRQPWVRLDGFATPDNLLAELRSVTAQK